MFIRTLLKAATRNIKITQRFYQHKSISGMELEQVIEKLEKFAPLVNAESWDNVGLLIEPATPKNIKNIFLTNDLTEVVLNEALEKKSDMIISYHPPIFAPLKRITQRTWKERIVAICLENKIALYSPHTAWDVAKGGVNDWLASAFDYSKILPIKSFPENPNEGIGRILTLNNPTQLKDIIEIIKKHAEIPTVHVAIGNQSNLNSAIRSVGICAGSGASLLKGTKADLYLSGEMSHHEVLDAIQNDISVILCNHSNSERGFLKNFKPQLHLLLDGKCDILISEKDRDPLSSY
ncbi:NIF3-like protein 1 [Condylostylus longicornis]|uniref:NIF3-like protein 1 n=1 Tax=Condylostylus longicornis TaxID=2530218 RepID=UPI00244E24A8|nr:NIF3-like protein 1 [Condylostylus longicornis]